MSRLRALGWLFPVLAMLFAVAGVANARLRGDAAGTPLVLALCSGSEQPAGGHDCLDCCLPGPVVTPSSAPALPTLWSSVAGPLLPDGRDFGLNGFGLARVLARGPPALAA